jgi:uncharacterized protein (TIGR02453 family)
LNEFAGFPKELFAFLTELGRNNNRDWFTANKERYVRYAKEPTLAFVGAMKDRLESISPSYIADTRANGGSMFRIYRDTRFARDKTPYKTNVGCHFRHSAGKDAHAPGFYVHLQPGESFGGGGIWTPPPPVLGKIRDAIDRNQDEWVRIKGYIGKGSYVAFNDAERYKRPPQGYAADHPLIEDLKLKSFYAGRSFTDDEVTSSGFIDLIAETYEDLAPFMRFINEALGLSF